MKVQFNQNRRPVLTPPHKQGALTLTDINSDEASTIWFSLDAYRRMLEDDIKKSERRNKKRGNDHFTYIEDVMFLSELLSKVTSVMFAMAYPSYQHLQHAVTVDETVEAHTAYKDWIEVL